MKERTLPRNPVILSESTQRKLGMYALTATAAGVSALALSQPAEAKIVYTPLHYVIHKNGYFGIDLNHDGIVDFTILNSAHTYASAVVNSIIAWPTQTQSDGVEGVWSNTYFIFELAFKEGKRIGYGHRFYQKGIMAAQCAHGTHTSGPVCNYLPYHTLGKWIDVKRRYLGLSFTIHGKTHYGWARLSVQVSKHPSKLVGILTGYAYETVAGKSIIAGKTKGPDVITLPMNTGTLGHLALGRK